MLAPESSNEIGVSWRAFIVVPAAYLEVFAPLFAGLGAVESLFECGEPKPGVMMWRVEGLFSGPPDGQDLAARAAILAASVGLPEPELIVEKVPATDWLTANVAAFPPIRAGRFFVHGDHVIGPFPSGALRLKVNAATAFGTGEHGSTRGCLLALDALRKAKSAVLRGGRRKTAVLDMGCGTGILAIAAAKAWNCKVLAADIDPEAVRVTRFNARSNGVFGLVRARLCDGPDTIWITQSAPFAVITANILARPLVSMAKPLSRLLMPGGTIILSGLLEGQESMVGNAYHTQGLRLVQRYRLTPWSTLVMKRAS
jgi:ribosomal protein L11 methyltransferase